MLISLAPAANSTAPQASRVAPVVSTSSTNRMRRPMMSAGTLASKTVATFCQRWARFFLVWVAVWALRRRAVGGPRQGHCFGQAFGKHGGLVVATLGQLAGVQGYGNDEVEVRGEAREV